VRTSLLAAGISVHAFQGTRWTIGGQLPRAEGNHHPPIAPYGMFTCKDGAVQMAVGSQSLWLRLCEAFGLDPGDPWFAINDDRARNRTELVELLERTFAATSSERLLDELPAAGIPAGKVRTLEEVYDGTRSKAKA
jgi:crotonobetainyl-CoA:carnitine CoA-transferase CaiB-like acyl-CoA transferase